VIFHYDDDESDQQDYEGEEQPALSLLFHFQSGLRSVLDNQMHLTI